jgi:cellulose synthase/poly-beta-1,6-N-acetylglucosamine synthase-like glycosyltransferase
MHVAIRIFWALGIGLLAQSVAVLFVTFNFLRYMRRSRSRPLNDFTPPVALTIACKGLEADFESNVSSYLCQDYPYYQVIFVVASVDDPAYQALRTRLEIVSKNKQNKELETVSPQERPPCYGDSKDGQNGGVQTALVVAGYSELRGEKAHNLLQGLKAVDARAEVLAFADIDARPGRDWLRSLVAPLQDPTVTVSTGFRWYLPGLGFVSHLRTAWDALNATFLGDHQYNFAWGGSMAVRTIDFKRLAVAERYWANAVSVDATLTRAVYEAGGRIRFEPRCLVACRGEMKFGEFLRWTARQMVTDRAYLPIAWWMGAAAYVFFCGTVLLGLIMLALPSISAGQRLLIAGILLATLLLVMSKGFIHLTIAKELFPEEAPSLRRYGARYWQLSLLVPWVTLINILVSSVTRRIEWRGTHYELRNVNEIRVIRREK